MLAGVIAVAAIGIGYLLIFDDDGGGDDDDNADPVAAGNRGEEDSDAPGGEEPGDDSDTSDPNRLTGTWEGTYTCAQGLTDMVLTLDDYGDGTVDAAWEFVTPEGEPGMFHLQGTYEGGQLSLEGTDWAEDLQPDNYRMVPLDADLSNREDTEHIEGDVPTEGCTDFSIQRTSKDPWYVGSWDGEYHCNDLEGKGGLGLTIEATGQDQADVVVNYFVLPDSTTDIPDGSHTATATYSERSLVMKAGEWIQQPPNYVAVDIITYEEAPTNPYKMIGIMDYPGCSLFTLDRVENGGSNGATESTRN